jgi:hypothetical protein
MVRRMRQEKQKLQSDEDMQNMGYMMLAEQRNEDKQKRGMTTGKG